MNTLLIKQLSYQDVENIKIPEYGVDILKTGIYYGLYIDDKLTSIVNILESTDYVKLRVNYTFPEYRGQGLFSNLLEYILELYPYKTYKAGCLESSYRLYLKKGFTIVKEKQFKKFKVYYMERK